MRNTLLLLFSLLLSVNFLSAQKKDKKSKFDAKKLDKYIQEGVTGLDLAGATVAIVRNDEVIFEKAYGYRDLEKKVPMKPGSVFNIASCSKAFTTAALAMLVQDGKLNWDDYVTDHIPGFRLNDPCITAQFTVADLVSHRSGFKTFMGDLLWYETDYENEEVMRRMRYLPIEQKYRADYGYQNNTFMIAGQVIEAASGMDWGTFVQKRILNPLNMTKTRLSGSHVQSSDELAWPHIAGSKIDYFHGQPHAAASLFSSSTEMTHWMRMMLNEGKFGEDKMLAYTSLNTLMTPHTPIPVGQGLRNRGTHFMSYGLGWYLSDYSGRMVVEHSGGMPGYISKVMLVPEENLGVVILTNDMNGGLLTGMLKYHLLDLFTANGKDNDYLKEFVGYKEAGEEYEARKRKKMEASRIPDTKPDRDLEAFTGAYEDKMYGKASLTLEGGKLNLVLEPTKKYFSSELEHWHYNTFKVQMKDPFMPPGLLTFHTGHDGKISHFTIDIDIADFHFYNLNFRKLEE